MLLGWYLSRKWEEEGLDENPLPKYQRALVGLFDGAIVVAAVTLIVYALEAFC